MDSGVVIIIPTYNEAENIPELLKRLNNLFIKGLQVVIVDDFSPDGTADIAEEIADSIGLEITLIRRSGKFGLGTAYVCGMEYVLELPVKFVVQMDADLSHPPEAILQMLKLLSKHDVIVGSRYVMDGEVDSDWGFIRKIVSSMGNFFGKSIVGLNPTDVTSGFKAYKLSVLKKIPLKKFLSKGFSFQIEMAYYCQQLSLDVVECPIIFNDRVRGVSKLRVSIILEALNLIFLLRVKKILRIR